MGISLTIVRSHVCHCLSTEIMPSAGVRSIYITNQQPVAIINNVVYGHLTKKVKTENRKAPANEALVSDGKP